MKRYKKIIIGIAITILIAILILNMAKINKSQSKYSKVLIIGIDGMDYNFTSILIKEGKLKNFEALSIKGSFSKLKTTYPPETPVAWTSMATGKNPGNHGIFDFIKRNPKNYMPELSTSNSRNTFFGTKFLPGYQEKTFWDVLEKEDIDTTIIRWPVTFPPKTKGKMISGVGVPDIKGNLAGYTVYSSIVMPAPEKPSNKLIVLEMKNNSIETEIIGPYVRKGNNVINANSEMKIKKNNDNAVLFVNNKEYVLKEKEWSKWIEIEFKINAFKKINGIAKAYLLSLDPLKIYLTSIHIDPKKPLTEISSPKSYSKNLAEKSGVFSTLGMPEETDGYIDGNLDKEGFLNLLYDLENEKEKLFWHEFSEFTKKDKGAYAFIFDGSDRLSHVMTNDSKMHENKEIIDYYIKKDEFLGKVLEKINNDTMLLVVSDHGFSTFEYAVSINNWLLEKGYLKINGEINQAGPLFKNVNWNETTAYSLGFASIYINQKGREGKGIIEDKEKTAEEIINGLKELKDTNGKKIFHGVYKKEEVYSGKYLENAPDIILGYNKGYRMAWQNAIGGFSEEIITNNNNKWKGDHLIDPFFVPGVIFSNEKLNKNASIIDVAPTIFEAFGINKAIISDGKSLLQNN